MYPADAHDAPLLPGNMRAINHWGRWFCNIWSLGGPCGRKCTQLMLMMLPSCLVKRAPSSLGQMVLQHLESRGAMWHPADAQDAPPLLKSLGQMLLQRLGGPCGRKCTQLMLMMLPSCLVKWAQSLAQMEHLESSGPCGWKCTQLMLMMLPSCLVKCA